MNDIIKHLQGIIGVVNTPFTARDQVDLLSVQRYVEHSLNCGVAGFLVGGLAAEINKLSLQEYLLITQTVLKQVNGKVPVIGGTQAENKAERLQRAGHLMDLGIDGLLVNIPFSDPPTYREQVIQITALSPELLMIQDWNFYGFGMPVEFIVQLFEEIGCFRSIKIEIVPAGIKYSQVLQATHGKIHMAGGWAGTQMIEALDRGVHAFMPTILHDVYGKIFSCHRQGRRKEAIDLFYQLIPVLAFSHQHPDICLHFNKRLLKGQGIFNTTTVREPALPFDAWHEQIARELVDRAVDLSKRCQSLSGKA